MASKELEHDTILCSPSLPQTTARRWWTEETVAVVTGANKGIGFAIVKRLAELGLTVVLTARNEEKGLEAVENLKRNNGISSVRFCILDVSDPSSISKFASWFKHNFVALDILINNAAVTFNDVDNEKTAEVTAEQAEEVMRTNFYGPKLLIEALLPCFRWGSPSFVRILNVTSRLGLLNKLKNPKLRKMLVDEQLSEDQIQGMVEMFLENVKNGTWKNQGWPEIWTEYAVSKLALNAFSMVLAKRFKLKGIGGSCHGLGLGVSVNCYCPGFTQTCMTGGKGKYSADDAAQVAAMLALIPPNQLPTGKFFLRHDPPNSATISSKL